VQDEGQGDSPGVNGLPVARVADRHVAERGQPAKPAEHGGIEAAAEDSLDGGMEPGEFGELPVELGACGKLFVLLIVDGAEDKEGDRAAGESFAVGRKEASRVAVDAGHVEGAAEDDGVEGVEAADGAHGAGFDEVTVLAEHGSDGLSDFRG